jgi:putative oxidoreductase
MTTAVTQPPTKKSGNLTGLYDHFARFAGKWQSPLLLLIRVYIGYQCALAGFGHLTHFHDSVHAFKGWHIPMPELSVAVAGATEIIGGALLVFGFAARLACLALTVNFVVAFLAPNLADPHYHQLLRHFWDNQDVLLKDDAFPFLMASILVLVFGPGFLSVDGIIKYVRGGKK